ncbi:MAG TPA: MMPL family transporter [Geothermobacteraceae bacterium]|nr:MMPL family transporter [Geothermobacteraceae bacterium]
MKLLLTRFSIRYPWLIVILVLLALGLFGSQFPKVNFDNDPENMLAADEPVRVFHHEIKKRFALYDFVIVGISNEKDPDGIFNVKTLDRIYDLTYALTRLQREPDGLPQIAWPGKNGAPEQRVSLDLTPKSSWQRILNTAFSVDPNRLFTENGESAIITREIISPSLVDNLKQAELGSLKLEYLMEHPPQTRAEALQIRDDAMGNPLYYGTLVAEDGKAICLYLPIVAKTFSYNVANLVRKLTANWDGADEVHITGLPVAEDTFGVEMLVQMATSAPLAMLAIFLLLLFFFRRLTIVIAPMLVAIGSVVCTMGLLIGLGYDVHIMSSMIAIFLMPIAVADSVHLLSEFYDSYHRFGDKRETLLHVIRQLFMPMLYTSLTTMAGFGSLIFTPIPPVKIFGAHIAFGVGLAWLLTMTLVPAYVMLAIPEKSLQKLQVSRETGEHHGPLARFLEALGHFSVRRWRLILVATLASLVVAAVGISRIQVNDNPVKWFTADHDIRKADALLNQHFGGTYTAYLTLAGEGTAQPGAQQLIDALRARLKDEAASSSAAAELFDRLNGLNPALAETELFDQLQQLANSIDGPQRSGWQTLGDEVNYLDPAGLTLASLTEQLKQNPVVDQQLVARLLMGLAARPELQGEALLDAALNRVDQVQQATLANLVNGVQTDLTAPLFKRPEVLRYLAKLQAALAVDPMVGKSSSVVDALEKGAYELQYRADQSEQQNRGRFAVPATVPAVAQVYTQLEGMKKKDALFHLVTRDYQQANVWVQLKSGDNKDMESVVADTEQFFVDNPPPVPLQHAWAGLTYLNVVWQDKMVNGMLWSLASSFVVVLMMMVVLFRSLWFGLLAMLPLSVTITLIYGLIGLAGKDYDMPVAVLSAMTLGLSVDFAIHFLERARQLQSESGSWFAAAQEMFKEPAMAISRNAIIISIGFTPLLVAPLVPYKTVGFFLATIMAVSWLATLFLLPAMLTLLRSRLFPGESGALSAEGDES